MQGNWKNWRNSFWWYANREQFWKNDFKRSSEFQKFSQENAEMFWWSSNRGKICQVVRESEKVENHCTRAFDSPRVLPKRQRSVLIFSRCPLSRCFTFRFSRLNNLQIICISIKSR